MAYLPEQKTLQDNTLMAFNPVVTNPSVVSGSPAVLSGKTYSDYKYTQQNNVQGIEQGVSQQRQVVDQNKAQQTISARPEWVLPGEQWTPGQTQLQYEKAGGKLASGITTAIPPVAKDAGSVIKDYLGEDGQIPEWSDIPYQGKTYQSVSPNEGYKLQYDQFGNVQTVQMTQQEIFQKQITDINTKVDTDYAAYQDKINQIQAGTYPLTPDQQAQVDSLRASFERAKADQLTANKNYEMGITQAGISSGRQRYAPELAMGEVKQAIDDGIDRINELDQKMAGAIATMKQGFLKDDYKMISDSWNQYQTYMTDKSTSIQKMADAVYQNEKDIRDFNLKVDMFNIQTQLESDKFDYLQKQDLIDNALKSAQFDETKKNNLRDYKTKLQQIEQGYLWKTSDAYGNPITIDTRTGEIKSFVLDFGQGEGLQSESNKAYNNAINNALIGSSKDESNRIRGLVNQSLKAGDITAAQETILRAAMKNAGVDQQSQALGRLQSAAALSDIKALFEAYVQETGDTGIVSGTIENLTEKLGRTTDPKLATIKNQVAQSLQVYRRAMTGVAFSPSESMEYKTIFPEITDVSKLAYTKIDSLLMSFSRNQKVFIGAMIGDSNYDEIFGDPTDPLKLNQTQNTNNNNPLGL